MRGKNPVRIRISPTAEPNHAATAVHTASICRRSWRYLGVWGHQGDQESKFSPGDAPGTTTEPERIPSKFVTETVTENSTRTSENPKP